MRQIGRPDYALVLSARYSGFSVRTRFHSFSVLGIPPFSLYMLDIRSQKLGRKALDDVLDILSDARLWSSLFHAQICPFAEVESFGYGQPGVRSYAWALLQALLENWTGTSLTTAPLLS